jgi:hypothetical protein
MKAEAVVVHNAGQNNIISQYVLMQINPVVSYSIYIKPVMSYTAPT